MISNPNVLKRLHKRKNQMFMEHLIRRSYNTSNEDIRSLKRDYGPMVPIFIYDSFMKGGVDDENFKDMAYFGPATTCDDQFVLLQNQVHTVLMPESPLVMNNFNLFRGNLRRIQGELYGVPIEHMFWLDKVYDNDTKFVCDYISILLHQSVEGAGILVKDVLCYFGEISTWTKPVNNLDKVQVSPNVINSEFLKNERVYRSFKHSPIKLKKEEITEADWMQMGFDDYGYGAM